MAEPEFLGSMQMDHCCCICLQPPPSHCAKIVLPCNHIFCEGCLSQACSTKMECPVDRNAITPESIHVAPPHVVALAEQCPVRCGNWKLGCPWAKEWKDWWLESHATSCHFQPLPPCSVPQCSSSDTAAVQQPNSHEQSHLYIHVRILASQLAAALTANRTLQHEVDSLKAALYAVQNDVSHVMHRQRELRELDATMRSQCAQSDEIDREQRLLSLPRFIVQNIATTSGHVEREKLEWDARLANRTLLINGASVTHSGAQRGWGTALSRQAVGASLGNPNVVKFSIIESGTSEVTNPSSTPFAQSMVMVGLVVDKSVLRETVSNAVSVHLGSLCGAWAYQGSGFVWVGDAKLCTQLQGSDSNGCQFGIGDVVECSIEVHSVNAAATGEFEARVYCRKNCSQERLLGATVPIGTRTVVDFFPAVSLGMHGATVLME